MSRILITGGCLVQGGACSQGGACCQGVNATGRVPAPRGCLVETPLDGYCCERYATYWNSFLKSEQSFMRYSDSVIAKAKLRFDLVVSQCECHYAFCVSAKSAVTQRDGGKCSMMYNINFRFYFSVIRERPRHRELEPPHDLQSLVQSVEPRPEPRVRDIPNQHEHRKQHQPAGNYG